MGIDIYFYRMDFAALEILQRVRKMNRNKVRIWIDSETKATASKKLGCFRDVEIVDRGVSINRTITNYEWLLCNCSVSVVCDAGRLSLIKRIVDRQAVNFVIVSAEQRCKNHMVIFLDAHHVQSLPDGFYTVPWFSSVLEVEEYCRKNGAFDLDLTNAAKFSDTGCVNAGAKVYREISTGRIIYRDTLHGDHYEVFDRAGFHLGEMDDNGVLDGTKADPRRHYRI